MLTAGAEGLVYIPAFYLMKHLAVCTRRGLKALGLSGEWSAYAVGFVSESGEKRLILVNSFDVE